MNFHEYYIKPSQGELSTATLSLPEEHSALISGTVLDSAQQPIPEALVLLLGQETGDLLMATLTDELGKYYFGPVSPDTLYKVRIQTPKLHPRILEL